MTTASALTRPAQIRIARRSPAYWRDTIDNPPINVMGPVMVQQFQEVIDALEADRETTVIEETARLDASYTSIPLKHLPSCQIGGSR